MKKYKVIVSEISEQDLENIILYIKNDLYGDIIADKYKILFKQNLKLLEDIAESMPVLDEKLTGNILHNNPDEDKYSCYKVVDSKGNLLKQFAFGGIEKQKEKLEKDGIVVIDYKVNLDEYKML